MDDAISFANTAPARKPCQITIHDHRWVTVSDIEPTAGFYYQGQQFIRAIGSDSCGRLRALCVNTGEITGFSSGIMVFRTTLELHVR